ncbi:unnamed protein product [Orchesella dallaii]|uniref:Lysosomal-associated transmembrane protein 4A n=1 Tax=Orchesella dallaii TaxID=48710 RepID=A0ABP1RQG2_9HEXA
MIGRVDHNQFNQFDTGGMSASGPQRRIRNDDNWKTCCCFQVRPVTIYIGIWDLIMDLLVLAFLAVLLTYDPGQVSYSGGAVITTTSYPIPVPDKKLPIPRSKHELLERLEKYRVLRQERTEFVLQASKKAALFLIPLTVFNTLMTLLMVYGAVRGKLAYLMVFLVLRVINFCIYCSAMLYYLPVLTELVINPAEKLPLPLREQILRENPSSLVVIIVIFMTILTIVKAVIIGVIWKCYWSLKLKNLRPEDPSSVIGLHQNFLQGDPISELEC